MRKWKTGVAAEIINIQRECYSFVTVVMRGLFLIKSRSLFQKVIDRFV